MPRNDQPARTKLTFSQAEGLEPLPQPLALGELLQEVRSLLWAMVYEKLRESSEYPGYGSQQVLCGPWLSILFDLHVRVAHLPADQYDANLNENVALLKRVIIKGAYNKVFDSLQFVMRHPLCPRRFAERVNWNLRAGRAAYRVIADGPTIIPTATPEEGAAITEAFRLLAEASFDGARSHLRGAADALNGGDAAGSVRESIHAVESVARRLNADASTTLGPALRALEERITLHPALKKGFSNIYGYTNDEEGIRHALLEGDADVDDVDATFMLGACASFVTYLLTNGGCYSRPDVFLGRKSCFVGALGSAGGGDRVPGNADVRGEGRRR